MSPDKILGFLLFLFCGHAAAAAADCDSIKTCGDCVAAASCGWCYRDGTCQPSDTTKSICLKGSMLESADNCSLAFVPKFNQSLALMLAEFSGAAYSDDPRECMAVRNRVANRDFQIVETFISYVELFNNKQFAFLAISEKLETVVLSFRGTDEMSELITEALKGLYPNTVHPVGGKVTQYFNYALNALWVNIRPALEKLFSEHPNYKLLVTGHSLGGALATLASIKIAYHKIVPVNRHTHITFGEPRVGNKDFAAAFDSLVWDAWRVVHNRDMVPHLPMCVGLSECWTWSYSPYHNAVEVFYKDKPMNLTANPNLQPKICREFPINEDENCSNGLVGITEKSCVWDAGLGCVQDHVWYYGIHFANYGLNNCTGEYKVFCKMPGCSLLRK